MPATKQRRTMSILLSCVLLLLLWQSYTQARAQSTGAQIRSFRITILSTMLVGQPTGIGEWGFAAVVEADGHKILVDTGAHSQTVLENARALHIDLSDVESVVLTHYHWDHVRGLMTLRRELMKKNPKALSVAYVAEGIFDSRPSSAGERNDMIAIRKEFEGNGGRFVVHSEGTEVFPGAWLTGPVPRQYPEHNWTGSARVQTASGLVEDNIPEDQSLILNAVKGLVVITGCGHAGIVNIATFTEKYFENRPIFGIVGGLHLFAASDKQIDWTAGMLRNYRVANLLAAHCTGIEATIRLRQDLSLTRATAVVATVGSSFSSEAGIETGELAR